MRLRVVVTGLVAGALVALAFTPPAAVAGPVAGPAASDWLPQTPDQWPLVVDEQRSTPQTLTNGLTHWSDQLQTAGGAQRAQVLNADLTDPNLRLGVVESHDHLTDPADEVPTSMANRTGAVAGINGDFFEIYASGRPEGMVDIDGRLVKSPDPARPWELWVRRDGSIGIGAETYVGTVTAGSDSHPITSVNTVNSLSQDALVRVTPDLGTPSPIPSSTVVTGHLAGSDLIVDSVAQGVTDLPQLPAGTEDLVGTATSGQWLTAHAHAGDRLAVAEKLAPDNDIQQAVGGGAILVQDGQRAVPLQGPGDNNINNPVTAVGVTKDGKHAVFAAFDGHQTEDVAQGLTRPQLAGWMLQHGAYNAILFDSGGSTQMVGRLPGQTKASVLNVPSDGHERPVANGLFFYSTEKQAGPARRAVVNAGKPLTVLAGTTVDIPAYAVDRANNPAREPVALSVQPRSLATVHGTSLTVGKHSGTGVVAVRAGGALSTVPLKVVSALSTVAVSPPKADLGNGDTQQLTVTATAPGGAAVTLPPGAVQWAVDPPTLGSISAAGLFTAGTTNALGTVTATAGGVHASTSIAVGQTARDVDPLTDISKWGVSDQYMNVYPRKVPDPGPHSTTDGSLAFAPDVKRTPEDAGSFDAHYHFAKADKTYDFDTYLNDPESEQIGLLEGNQAPTGVGVWVKGNADLASRPGAPLAPGIVTLNLGIWQSTNQPTSFYATGITFGDWQYVVAKLPTGLQFPLRINYIALVVIKPDRDLDGDVYLSGLQALYSPRPPTPPTYTAIPKNPSWLQFSDVDSFKPGGTTLAAMDDAHVVPDQTAATGPTVMRQIASDFSALPAQAKPDQVQALGDMPDNGKLDTLNYAKSLLTGLGVPFRDAPGNHEITQGADPENGNFASVFGATHYSYQDGPANVIVSDSSHIGILASDPFQSVDTGISQYQWLVQQLSANTSKVAIVVTHTPAYDPHPRADSQFADRWEAQMYETLLTRYRASHPGVHVLLLFGHARGFAENLLTPTGVNDPSGLPNFVVADAGSPPYASTDQGGFYNYGLFHVLPNGDVQFAVQPVLASIAVTASAGTLGVGGHEQLLASGTSVTGDDATALTVPIADPVSRVWSSSNPRVVSVDRATGAVQALRAGTATITVQAGSVSGHTDMTVTG